MRTKEGLRALKDYGLSPEAVLDMTVGDIMEPTDVEAMIGHASRRGARKMDQVNKLLLGGSIRVQSKWSWWSPLLAAPAALALAMGGSGGYGGKLVVAASTAACAAHYIMRSEWSLTPSASERKLAG
jgi:hypothetical protein